MGQHSPSMKFHLVKTLACPVEAKIVSLPLICPQPTHTTLINKSHIYNICYIWSCLPVQNIQQEYFASLLLDFIYLGTVGDFFLFFYCKQSEDSSIFSFFQQSTGDNLFPKVQSPVEKDILQQQCTNNDDDQFQESASELKNSINLICFYFAVVQFDQLKYFLLIFYISISLHSRRQSNLAAAKQINKCYFDERANIMFSFNGCY